MSNLQITSPCGTIVFGKVILCVIMMIMKVMKGMYIVKVLGALYRIENRYKTQCLLCESLDVLAF